MDGEGCAPGAAGAEHVAHIAEGGEGFGEKRHAHGARIGSEHQGQDDQAGDDIANAFEAQPCPGFGVRRGQLEPEGRGHFFWRCDVEAANDDDSGSEESGDGERDGGVHDISPLENLATL